MSYYERFLRAIRETYGSVIENVLVDYDPTARIINSDLESSIHMLGVPIEAIALTEDGDLLVTNEDGEMSRAFFTSKEVWAMRDPKATPEELAGIDRTELARIHDESTHLVPYYANTAYSPEAFDVGDVEVPAGSYAFFNEEVNNIAIHARLSSEAVVLPLLGFYGNRIHKLDKKNNPKDGVEFVTVYGQEWRLLAELENLEDTDRENIILNTLDVLSTADGLHLSIGAQAHVYMNILTGDIRFGNLQEAVIQIKRLHYGDEDLPPTIYGNYTRIINDDLTNEEDIEVVLARFDDAFPFQSVQIMTELNKRKLRVSLKNVRKVATELWVAMSATKSTMSATKLKRK